VPSSFVPNIKDREVRFERGERVTIGRRETVLSLRAAAAHLVHLDIVVLAPDHQPGHPRYPAGDRGDAQPLERVGSG
jgi:hypothetical protein